MSSIDILANPKEDEEEYDSYLDWLSNGFETHLFCVRDEELCMDDYLRAVRISQKMMGNRHV